MRIAEEHASFGVTCRRWSIGQADGGSQCLPRIVAKMIDRVSLLAIPAGLIALA